MSSSWIEDPGIAIFNGFNISSLGIDEAYLNVTSLVTDGAMWLYELSTDCHKCPFEKKSMLNFSEPFSFKISTKFPMKYRFRPREGELYLKELGNDSYKSCDIEHTFGEFGVYNLYVEGSQREFGCRVETALEPVNIYYPLILAFLFYLVFGLLFLIASKGHSRLQSWFKSSSSGSSKTSSSTVENNPGSGGQEIAQNPSTIYASSSHPPEIRRLSTASGNGGAGGAGIGTNPQGGFANSNGHGHYGSSANVNSAVYGYHNGNGVVTSNYAPPQSGHSPTEVSTISTISSTPTSSSGVMTSYGKPQPNHPHHLGGDVIESPSTPGGGSNRMQINSTITNNNAHNNSNTNPNQQPKQPSRQRLRSLDTFRGICIVVMILANDGGAGYTFLGHATWDGLYVADLVFPWFLWIMGVCIPVSIKSQVKRGNSRFAILKRIFIRSCKLIALGILLGSLWGPVDIHTMRIPGVLQRFGICYFVCCTLVLFCMTINITKPEASKLRAVLQDVQIIWIAWLLVLILILAHCMLTFFLEVPGCPTGYLGPGGLHDYFYEPYRTVPSHCVGGAAGFIDKKVLQERHIYQWPTTKGTYKSDAYEPEGILGMLTSIFQVWLGVQTGVTMLVYPRPLSRLKRWGTWAVITGALGALLCGCKQTDGWIPLNKNLWSLSFVLVTNCFALILLSLLYFLIDIKRWWSGSPLFEPGMNSILLYVGHSVCSVMLPFHYTYGPMRTHFSRLIESLWGTSLWVGIAIYLYSKKRFWTV